MVARKGETKQEKGNLMMSPLGNILHDKVVQDHSGKFVKNFQICPVSMQASDVPKAKVQNYALPNSVMDSI